jgi:hypothetical protein
VPFAQAAHSGLTVVACGSPNTAAPPRRGCASAIIRAETTGRRLSAAIATAALSMIRLTIISRHVLRHRHPVGGDAGDLPGELLLARQEVLRRMDADGMKLHGRVLSSCGVAHRPLLIGAAQRS